MGSLILWTFKQIYRDSRDRDRDRDRDCDRDRDRVMVVESRLVLIY